MRRSVGMLFLFGSVAFLVGVMFPVVQEVFADLDDREAMASAISGSPSVWRLANVLFGIGALVVGVALWMVTRTVEGGTARAVGRAAGVSAIVGALVYGWTVVQRVSGSPEEVAQAINDPEWDGLVYAVLTQLAFIGAGYVILRSGPRRWTGWVLLVVGVGTLIGYLVLGDIPPGVYYAVTLLVGIAAIAGKDLSSRPS